MDTEIVDFPEKFALVIAFLGSAYLFLRIGLALFCLVLSIFPGIASACW